MVYTVRVWDLPTRLFHWSLALCLVGSVASGLMGDWALVWHFRLGYTVLSLLLFRLVWGFVGGHWARFASFVVGPCTVWRHLQRHGNNAQSVGHNPLGSLSVLAMLGFTLLQVATGLCSDDEIASAGPLVKWLTEIWVHRATYYHAHIGKLVLIALVVLHLAALAFYRVRRKQRLVGAMLSGDKQLPRDSLGSRDDAKSRLLALAIYLACAGGVAGCLQWLD